MKSKRLSAQQVEAVIRDTGIARSRVGVDRDRIVVLASNGAAITVPLTLTHTESHVGGMERLRNAILEAKTS
jgi:hypothetical protein